MQQREVKVVRRASDWGTASDESYVVNLPASISLDVAATHLHSRPATATATATEPHQQPKPLVHNLPSMAWTTPLEQIYQPHHEYHQPMVGSAAHALRSMHQLQHQQFAPVPVPMPWEVAPVQGYGGMFLPPPPQVLQTMMAHQQAYRASDASTPAIVETPAEGTKENRDQQNQRPSTAGEEVKPVEEVEEKEKAPDEHAEPASEPPQQQEAAAAASSSREAELLAEVERLKQENEALSAALSAALAEARAAGAAAEAAADSAAPAPAASAESSVEKMSDEMANLPDDDIDAKRALAMRMLTAAMQPSP